jgi:thiamine biosynthesis lipoprotein
MVKLLFYIALLSQIHQPPRSRNLFHETRPAMGTSFEVYLYAPDRAAAKELFELVFVEVERLEGALSNYRPSSEISRINRLAGRQKVTTDPEIFGLIERSLAFSRQTTGAFDITVGPLTKAWGFFRGQGGLPSEKELVRARARTGWRFVELDVDSRMIRFLRPDIELDLGGVGKGYALDRVAAVLEARGVQTALVSAGQSSYLALGAPPGEKGWLVHVPHPEDRSKRLSSVFLKDEALSTSGSTEKFFELEGRRYSHIINPRTGYPVEGIVQVTVSSSTAESADALSTSLFVLGPKNGRELLDTHGGASALIVKMDEALDQTEVITIDWPGQSLTESKSLHRKNSSRSDNP